MAARPNEKEKRLHERRKPRKVKKTKAFFVFLLLIIVFLSFCYGTWKGFVLYHQPWGVPLTETSYRLPNERFDERFFSLLVIGIGQSEKSDQNEEADSFILLIIDKETRNMNFLLVPRNAAAITPEGREEMTLSAIYSDKGRDVLVSSIEHLLQIPIQHYLTLRPGSLPAIIDAMGGLEIYIPDDMKYSDPYADPPLEINLKKGTQRLSGGEVMKFLQYRSDELGEIGRLKRQQIFLRVFQEQVGRAKILFNSYWMIKAMVGKIETDMSLADFSSISWYSIRGQSKKMEILPGTDQGRFWRIDEEQWGNKEKEIIPFWTQE